MKLFIISVPALVFLGLLSSAAPLLHVAGPPATPSAAPFATDRALVMAYYPDWASRSLPPEKIDFARFDWIDFAFALPDQSFALTWDDPANVPPLLDRLVSCAHGAGKRVKLSIGGWTGSQLRIVFPGLMYSPLLHTCTDTSPLLWRRTETGRSLPRTSLTLTTVSLSMGSTLIGNTPVSRVTLRTVFPHRTRQTTCAFCSSCALCSPRPPR